MTDAEMLAALKNFMDAEHRLRAYPAREKVRRVLFLYLAGKIEPAREYTEKEIGETLSAWHTFGDPCLLRRELCDRGLLCRDPEGRRYRRAAEDSPAARE